MFENIKIEHHVQQSILSYLTKNQFARFRDMRPRRVDSNLYSYHLKLLQKQQIVDKQELGYTLSQIGAAYVERMNDDSQPICSQPRIITMSIIQNEEGGVLLCQKSRQPFISRWTLPSGPVLTCDNTVADAASRVLVETVDDLRVTLQHKGDCYIRVRHEDRLLMSNFVHVFYGLADYQLENSNVSWVNPYQLQSYNMAPGINKIIARTFFQDPFFFEEFDVAWQA